MSAPREETINDVVHAQLRRAFGEPHTSTGGGEHWTFRPMAQGSHSINVLANGTTNGATVWIIDPNQRENGVAAFTVTRCDEINNVISQIHRKLNRTAPHACENEHS